MINKVIIEEQIIELSHVDEKSGFKQFLIPQFFLDRLVAFITQATQEARLSEANKLMEYSKTLPNVFVKPNDREKMREFSRAAILIAEHAQDRIKQLSINSKEKSNG